MNQESPHNRKKVLFVITKSNFGGAQRYVYDLATKLPRESFEVAVAFGGTGAAGSAAGTLAKMLAEADVRTLLIPELARDINIRTEIAALFAVIKLFKDERPDVVHLNSSKVGGLGALAARLVGIRRIVFTVHGWPFWEKRNALARILIFFFSYLTILLSHRTICISNYDSRAMIEMPFAHRRILVVHNGLSPIDFFMRDEAQAKLLPASVINLHAQDTRVITNAELHPNKNLFIAIDAVATYNKTHSSKIFYCIMGTGELKTAIEKYITAHNLSDQVKLLGFVPDGRRYMRGFDIFFLPSRKEGVPYVLIEAGAAGLPIVASSVGGIPEVVTNGETGYLHAPDDTQGFADALERLAENLPLRAHMGEKLKTKIARDYSLKSMIEGTITVY